MDNFIKEISSYPNGTSLLIEFLNGLRIKGKLDTIYETDNGLEMDEEGYLEYYACTVEIETIKNHPQEMDKHIKKGNLIEVSIHNELLSVSLDDGTVIWSSRKNS